MITNDDKLKKTAEHVVDWFYKDHGVYQPIDHTVRREFEKRMRKLRATLTDSVTEPKDMDTWICNVCHCSWHIWKGQPHWTCCPNCQGHNIYKGAPTTNAPSFLHACSFCGYTGVCSAHQRADPTCKTCFSERADD